MKNHMIAPVVMLAILWMGMAPLLAQEKSFSGGTGTAESPWQISTPADLNNIRNYLGDAHSDKHFVLINDIDLTDATRDGGAYWNDGAGWHPIGSLGNGFEGVFDGGGHVITGLFINRPTGVWIGLFGFVVGGTLKNIGLEGADITGEVITGALVGQNNGGLISSSYATGVVTGETGDYIGGLAGFNGSGGQVLSSYSEITVAFGPEPGIGGMGVGGLVGNNAGTISMSFATGDISTTEVVRFIGGLVGRNEGADAIISQSFATGNVSSGGGYLGGLAGLNWPATARIIQSFATGDANNPTGTDGDRNIRVGGLVGDNYGIIEQSYAQGNAGAYTDVGGLVGFNRNDAHVSGAYATGQRTRGSRFGGIAGFNEGNIENAYWDKQVYGTGDGLGGEDGTSSNIIGIETTAAMQGSAAATNMALFDFAEMWETVEGSQADATADGYPILQGIPRLDQLDAQGKLQMRTLSLSRDPDAGGTVSGEGSHGVFAEVPISVATNNGYLFTGWTGETDHLEDAEAESTTVTMPNQDITLTANFKPGIAWTGGSSTAWDNTGNWNTDAIPGEADNVRISVVDGGVYPLISDVRNTIDLEIREGAQITLGTGGRLSVSGVLDNRGGAAAMIIQSDVGGTGSLIHTTAGVEATVQRYIPAAGAWVTGKDVAVDWHFLSSPVANHAFAPNFLVDPANEYNIYRWNETGNIWENHLAAANPFGEFELGRGYLVAYKDVTTREFEGVLNVADVSRPSLTIGDGSGWHLMGNPFASGLEWKPADWGLGANFVHTAKLWAAGAYIDILDEEPIASMQGFFVQALVADQTLTIPAAFRIHDGAWQKSRTRDRILLEARATDSRLHQRTVIRFNDEAEGDFDYRFDSRFLAGYAPMLYIVSGDEYLSTKTYKELHRDLQIPLGFAANHEGSVFEITLAENTYDTGIWLHDRQTGEVHELTDEPVYRFSSGSGDDALRFELLFSYEEDPTGVIGSEADDLTRIYVCGQTLYLEFASGDADRLLEVFDTSGRLLMREDLGAGSRLSRALNLQPGVYVVRVSGPQGVATRRIAIP